MMVNGGVIATCGLDRQGSNLAENADRSPETSY
jgi:hypothetical protein